MSRIKAFSKFCQFVFSLDCLQVQRLHNTDAMAGTKAANSTSCSGLDDPAVCSSIDLWVLKWLIASPQIFSVSMFSVDVVFR